MSTWCANRLHNVKKQAIFLILRIYRKKMSFTRSKWQLKRYDTIEIDRENIKKTLIKFKAKPQF